MIKQPITYQNYDDKTVTETFCFNLNKLELMEMEIEFDGGLKAHIEKLMAVEDGKEAYFLFKDILLKSYGEFPDGVHFRKKDDNGNPLYRNFESSPALGELIFGFLKDGGSAAQFVRGLMPAQLIAEAEAEAAAEGAKTATPAVTAPPVVDDPPTKKLEEYTEEELVEMPQAEFEALVGTDSKKWTKPILQIAFQRKSKES